MRLPFFTGDRSSGLSPRHKPLVRGPWILVIILCVLLFLATFRDLSRLPERSLESAFDIGQLVGLNGNGGQGRRMRGQNLVALDWISTWEPPTGFEKWVKFAKDNKCHLGSYTRIEKDLQQFRDERHPMKRHITLRQIEAAKKLGNVVVFSVKNGRLKILGEKSDFASKFAGLMKRFVKHLPDMEFVVNSLDEPRSLPGETEDIDKRYASKQCENASETFRLYRHLHGTINNRAQEGAYIPSRELLPIFSQSKINECYADITYPTLYNLDNLLTKAEEQELLPWALRNDTLFFRGATTGGFYTASLDFTKAHRQRLVEHAMKHPHMDIKFSSFLQCPQEVCKKMADKYGFGTWVKQIDNFKYKYLMSIDGNTFVSRLPLFLSSGSVPFRTGIYSEWYDEWIHENEHFIQVKLDYSDLNQKLQWALEHNDEMRVIGQQGRLFARTRLRNEDMECYLFRLLLEYAAIVY